MRQRIIYIFATLLTALLLLLGSNLQHSQAMSAPMPEHMPEHASMNIKDCASLCSLSRLPAEKLLMNRYENEVDKEPVPSVDEPYYAQYFVIVSVVNTVAAIYIFAYLRWRPPDLYIRYATLRF